jgi:hypothetical protein
MPNIEIVKYRLWCKSCKDFTLHERIFKDELSHAKYSHCSFHEFKDYASLCEECNLQYTSVKVLAIDPEKLSEQRERFKAQRKKEFWEATSFIMGGGLASFNGLPSVKRTIRESDAGLEHEEQLQKEAKEKRKEEERQELERFKDVGRNDPCLCGSGKKYKNCCLSKHKR